MGCETQRIHLIQELPGTATGPANAGRPQDALGEPESGLCPVPAAGHRTCLVLLETEQSFLGRFRDAADIHVFWVVCQFDDPRNGIGCCRGGGLQSGFARMW